MANYLHSIAKQTMDIALKSLEVKFDSKVKPALNPNMIRKWPQHWEDKKLK